MASYQIATPEKFTFRQPDKWQTWIRRFERFRLASGLEEKGEESQVNALIYCMGPEADDILASFNLSADDSKIFDTVKAKFESRFIKKRNVVFERAKFNLRKQEESEAVDTFITSLYQLSEHCNYGNLRDELIRYRDRSTRQETLHEAPNGRWIDTRKGSGNSTPTRDVKREQAALKQDDITGESIDRLWTKRPPYRPGGRKQDDALAPPTFTRAPHPTCMKCGRGPHSKYVCPARAATCNKCPKVGHNGDCCRNKAVREVSSECAQEASAFLGAMGESKDDSNPWKVSLKLNSVPVELKIDTGAEVSVIPESVFKKLEGIALIPMSKTLYGPGSHVLFVSGKFTATLQLDKQEVREEMFVIPELKNALLGQPAIKSLNLLSRVCSVESDTAKIVADHPKLFEGLGNLEGEYRIELKPEAEPFALSTPRRVAITLMAKVKAELEEMERSGIISRVDEPTDWCSGMVIVPKSDGRVRICVDLSKLNESVKRNRHILPSVEQSLAQLGGATVFSWVLAGQIAS